MTDKSLPIIFMDLLVAATAIAGVVLAIRVFHVPNCTAIANEPLFKLVRPSSEALVAACILGLLIGVREDSRVSKLIGSSCAFAAILLWVIYPWKMHAISALAC